MKLIGINIRNYLKTLELYSNNNNSNSSNSSFGDINKLEKINYFNKTKFLLYCHINNYFNDSNYILDEIDSRIKIKIEDIINNIIKEINNNKFDSDYIYNFFYKEFIINITNNNQISLN